MDDSDPRKDIEELLGDFVIHKETHRIRPRGWHEVQALKEIKWVPSSCVSSLIYVASTRGWREATRWTTAGFEERLGIPARQKAIVLQPKGRLCAASYGRRGKKTAKRDPLGRPCEPRREALSIEGIVSNSGLSSAFPRGVCRETRVTCTQDKIRVLLQSWLQCSSTVNIQTPKLPLLFCRQ